MEILFWVIVAAMTGLALLMIVPALLKQENTENSVLDEENIAIARQRLVELKAQLVSGALTDIQYQEQYSELEAALNDDLDLSKKDIQDNKSGKWMIFPIFLGVPVLAASLYMALGNFDAIEKVNTGQAVVQQNSKVPDVNAMVAGLAERLKQQPDDPEGWLMLGRSYKYMQQYDKAAEAFAQAHRLMGDQTDLLLQYADSLAMAQKGSLKGKATELVLKAVKQSPDNQTALWLAGMAKAEVGDYAQALQYWQKLQKMFPPESKSYQEVTNLITQIQDQQPGLQAEKTALTDDENRKIEKPAELQVKVNLSQQLKDKVSPEDTVFIYAQAMNGPKMPLAIVKEQVKNLPLTVALSDQQAMTPMMKLSSFEQVKIIARVSKSGSAIPQPGDLIGSISPVSSTETKLVEIEISREIQ
jgi:cytochrome c-type biogenesis protein CcmH